jgi:hypothetical protein
MPLSSNKPSQNTQRYWAYANYIVSISRLITQAYPVDSVLAGKITTSKGFQKLSRKGEIDKEHIAVLLRHSWFTELLLSETQKSEDLLLYANPWSMVQSYYAIYPGIRAYFLALNRPVKKTHHTTLGTICSDLTSYKDRFPQPWRTVLADDPAEDAIKLVNGPASLTLNLRNPLASLPGTDPWQFYGLLLRTTRSRQVKKSVNDWKQTHARKRIYKRERTQLIANLRPTTMFDFLYRMRTRSNYQDIDSFAFSDVTTADAVDLQQGICHVVYATLFVFETMIAKIGGKKWFTERVEEFYGSTGEPAGNTIVKRWDVIRKYL